MRVFALILAACAATTLNWSGPAHSAPSSASATAEERLPHISVQSVGKGSPVVLIPGLSSPRAVWDGIAPKLAQDHKVILVQVNGFAGDDPGANLEPGVLAGIVDDLHGYVASHHLGRVRVIGHSMGGLAALMFAKAHPDQVEQVMVVDALPFFAVLMDPKATVGCGQADGRDDARESRVRLWQARRSGDASRRTSNRSRSSPKASCA